VAKKMLEKVHPEGSDWKRQEWDMSGGEEKNVSGVLERRGETG
jgi:hypothetical protein